MRALVELRGQGERLPGLLYQIVRRLRDAVAVAEALAAGQPPAQARRALRMPPQAAERFMADVAKRDVDVGSLRWRDLELDGRPRARETAAARGGAARRGDAVAELGMRIGRTGIAPPVMAATGCRRA